MKPFLILHTTACLLLLAAPWSSAQTTIQPDTAYQFSQSHKSTARYFIALPHPGEYTIHITNWVSTYNWGDDYDRLYLYNDEAKPVQRNQFSSEIDPFAFHMFEGVDSLVFRVGTAGTYTIDVHSGNIDPAQSQTYGLQVTSTYCNDTHEPNELRSAATTITLGSTVNGYQWRPDKTSAVHGDEDWYQIQLPGPGKLRMELVDWIGTYNWGADFDRLYVYDAAGNNISGTDADAYYRWMMQGSAVGEPFVIEMNLAKGGTYYLRFHAGDSTSTMPYRFTTSFIQATDSFEPNDSLDTARPIAKSDVALNACAWRSADQTMNVTGDEDYYYFYAAGPGLYTVSLTGWIGIYNWGADYDRMYLYDGNRQMVGDGAIRGMMSDTPFTFEVPAAGKYYIQMHCGAAYSLDGYTIKLTGNFLGPEIAVEQPLANNLVDGNAVTGFGKIRIGSTGKTKTYTIRNKGVTTLNLSKITKSGTAATSFAVTQPAKLSLPPGKSTTFKVTFKPKAAGILKAAIQIRSNDKNESPFDIKLTGRGMN